MSKNFQKQLQKKFEADRAAKLKKATAPKQDPQPEKQTQEQIRAALAIRDGFKADGTIESFGIPQKPQESFLGPLTVVKNLGDGLVEVKKPDGETLAVSPGIMSPKLN